MERQKYFFEMEKRVIFMLKKDIFTGCSNSHTTINKVLVRPRNYINSVNLILNNYNEQKQTRSMASWPA